MGAVAVAAARQTAFAHNVPTAEAKLAVLTFPRPQHLPRLALLLVPLPLGADRHTLNAAPFGNKASFNVSRPFARPRQPAAYSFRQVVRLFTLFLLI